MSQVSTPHGNATPSDDSDWRGLTRVRIPVSADAYDAFVAMLDREPQYLPRLAKRLAEPSVFDGTNVGELPTPG